MFNQLHFEFFLLLEVDLLVVSNFLVDSPVHLGEFLLVVGEAIEDKILIKNVTVAEVVGLIAIHIEILLQLVGPTATPTLGSPDS